MRTINIIIPTYKPNPYLDTAVKSVLTQNYPTNLIYITIVVNGPNKKYFEDIKKEYSSHDNITVLYTEHKGQSIARNIAITNTQTYYTMFLDDDDYLTKGYIYELVSYMTDDIDIVCGKLTDYDDQNNTLNSKNYITDFINKIHFTETNDIFLCAPLFSTLPTKLYKSSFIQQCELLDIHLRSSEDIEFWAKNASKVKKIAIVDKNSQEFYIRRITPSSVSRPNSDFFDFYIAQRMILIEKCSINIFKNSDINIKNFILSKIDTQANVMYNYFSCLQNEDKEMARKIIYSSTCPFINKGKYSDIKGVAFCHNFVPYADTAAYVAAKRLDELASLIGKIINWTVFRGDMKYRGSDNIFNIFYAKYKYSNIKEIGGRAFFNEESQYIWGKLAYEEAKNEKYTYIYSRSMFAGSHVAAYLYKQHYPKSIWYAEFSDPIYMDAYHHPRKPAKQYDSSKTFLNTFWQDIEKNVFEYADKIIFTNQNQMDYMLKMHPSPLCVDKIRKKSIILSHPILDISYSHIYSSTYKLNQNDINIGYFGHFHPKRNGISMFKLLYHRNVKLHIFTNGNNLVIPEEYAQLKEQIIINNIVSYFEFLNIASKMDFLFLEDINFEYSINPFLPSKLADYLASGTKILAKIYDNTELYNKSKTNVNIINIQDILCYDDLLAHLNYSRFTSIKNKVLK